MFLHATSEYECSPGLEGVTELVENERSSDAWLREVQCEAAEANQTTHGIEAFVLKDPSNGVRDRHPVATCCVHV